MAMGKTASNVLKLVICIAACLTAGLVGSLFTAPAIPAWYAGLNKPVFTPPNWLFAPAWTVLYILMGIAAFLVWRKGWQERRVRSGLILFLIQLVFNAMWSVFFFGFRSPVVGFIVIVVLWFLILFTIIEFYRAVRLAAYLMIPYILWVTFASVLNAAVCLLNP
jgi:tryptophan-rich sensory protein